MESQDCRPIDSSYIPIMVHLHDYTTDWLIFAVVFIPALLLLVALSVPRAGKDTLVNSNTKTPSTYPFTIPIVGHALSMAWDPDKFLFSVT